MSLPTLEKKTAVDAGSDLASLVVANCSIHHDIHCDRDMCRVANECLTLDEAFYGTDV